MNDYTTTAQEILDTIGFDELSSADLANHLDIDFDHVRDEEDGIRVEREDGTIRYWGLEYDDEGKADGYSFADYELDENGDEQNIGQDGGPLNNVEDLDRALRELADFTAE